MTDQPFFVAAPKHLGSLLAEELARLGLREAVETRGGARFVGTIADAYRACLWSRVANRVLLPLGRFAADSPDALYAGARAIHWEDHLSPDRTFAVQVDGVMAGVRHTQYAAVRVKDAIADRFVERLGRRPSVDTHAPDLSVHVYANQGEAILSIDLSGASLHRRGYRHTLSAAPLKENLAAALLLRADWPAIAAAGGALLDPMCGSGTLIIEGALIAADIAPGLLRERFGFMGWQGHDERAWRALRAEAEERRARGLERLGSLRGYDQDPGVIRLALEDLARAGLAGRAHFERRELSDCWPGRADDRGLVIVNPPYGERLGEAAELPALYARLGSVLKERFHGWRAAVFTANPQLGKQLGLRAQRMHSIYNGPIACRLLHFDISADAIISHRPRALPAEARDEGARMLANRLAKNLKSLARWRRARQIDCFRLYDADLPEYALAIDVYEGAQRWVHVQEYAAPKTVDAARARQRLRAALGVIPEVLEVPQSQLFYKLRAPQKGLSQYERLAETRRFHEVQEGGHRFLVNFEDYLDTGLFLDHREIRGLIGTLAAGKRFLNLFAYTGSATVHAIKGGATSTVTLDMSRTYLDWTERNLALNGISVGRDHELIQADCLAWLQQRVWPRRFDLILLDPPSFSASKRMRATLDIQRDHVALIQSTVRLLAPGGVLIFSNNLRRFRMDHAALAELALTDISAATLPKDFARNPRIHQCWRIQPANTSV
ncbi:MAG: bifunctional 23S rRNA (guanine(2069)-N(7))-methyltransferase RlmK/23S rRNA (guanine(2445)-N(2))-methyltransferase RlmL [Sphingobacteriia bacterium]|nr:bifunctional 23S rRNA (guanine(2069)-N(7))-methyltransferase RlmK/23S rRNA (guanine(2445)-N(2))-methyltransferase RlmL [Sphingobacteriia bacterium]NCC37936.1 bifunctional 23S rRNA (guanine(2069)-N(7))-methyltransferase RlmK/23S rRNA (guanine(2445)-N(2))-methyltransferase RlmL [Gammaproteobacteria bacterium]